MGKLIPGNWKEIKVFFAKETKKHTLIRFSILILFIFIYFIYEAKSLGTEKGLLVTALTWSFFVFCTPIADAGFVLAFPTRLLTGIRMIYTQIFSYFLALGIVIGTLILNPSVFDKTILLRLFKTILLTPYPYWTILLLSLIGTFFSIVFGDELIDVNSHKEREKYYKHMNKYKIVVTLFIIAMTIALYDFLLKSLGVHIPLI